MTQSSNQPPTQPPNDPQPDAPADNRAAVQAQYTAHGEKYATSRPHAEGYSLARAVELVQPQPHWRGLDIATGAGHFALAFAPHIAHMTATDLTPKMLTVAAELAQTRNIANIDFQEADAQDLPFDAAVFDLVLCRIAPHHFPDVAQFVAECARVLRPGGVFVLVDNVTPAGEGGDFVNDFERRRDPSHARALSRAEWRDLLTAAGFAVVHEETWAKVMEFQPWAERMGASAETITQLRHDLLHAPPAVAAYFAPKMEGDTLFFQLEEGIFIGRKST
jgi:ubiquinone/menaquinone biosynthesis C-methylase UbiE